MGNKQSSRGNETTGTNSGQGGSAAPPPPSQPSWYEQAKAGYAEVVNAIIRPPRAQYKTADLGPTEFTFCGQEFRRTDMTLKNDRGLTIQCSQWGRAKAAGPVPCVIVMHGNSSCRLSALEVLESALAEGCMLFTFDFSGSGLSDGEYVSLGHFEKDDLQAVVAHLRGSGAASTIALWGRSMGAATALLHGHRDPSIAAMVLDSPFASLKQLARELVARGKQASGYNVPDFVVSMAISWVTSSVQKKAGFDMNKLTPIADVDKCFIPALFVAGRQDDFIAPHHAQEIHDKYAGDKNISLVVGQHNSPRPGWWKDSAAIFLRQYMQIPEGAQLDRGHGDTLQAAWNRAAGGGRALGGTVQQLAEAEAAMMRRAMQASVMVGSAGGADAPAAAASGGGVQGSSAPAEAPPAAAAGGHTGASKDGAGAPSGAGPSIAAVQRGASATPPMPPSQFGDDDDPGLAVAIALSLEAPGAAGTGQAPTETIGERSNSGQS